MTYAPFHDGFSCPSVVNPQSRNIVRHASEIVRQNSASDPTEVGEQTCTFLRQMHPRATAENVAADLKAFRVKSATIAKMLERKSTPSTPLMLALACFYGPEFLCAVLPSPPRWLSAAYRAEKQVELEAKMAALKTELERL